MPGFLTLLKFSRTYRVDLAIESQRDMVFKLSAFLCFVLLGAAPIQYLMYRRPF